MRNTIRFLYDGSWTQKFDFDEVPWNELNQKDIMECHIEEFLTKAEYELMIKKYNET